MSINSDNIFVKSDYDNFQLGGKKSKRKKSRRKPRKPSKPSKPRKRSKSRKRSKKSQNIYSVSIFDEKDEELSIFNPGYEKKVYPRHRDEYRESYRRPRPLYNGVIMSPSVVVQSPVQSIEKLAENIANKAVKASRSEGMIPQIDPMAREMMGNKLSVALGQTQMQQMPYEAMTNMPQQLQPRMPTQMPAQMQQMQQMPYEAMTNMPATTMQPQQYIQPQMMPSQMMQRSNPLMGEGEPQQTGGNITVESDFDNQDIRVDSDFESMIGGGKRKGSKRKGSKRKSSKRKSSRRKSSRRKSSRGKSYKINRDDDYSINLDQDDEELFERSDTRYRYSNYYSPAHYSPIIISSISDGLQPYHSMTNTRPVITNPLIIPQISGINTSNTLSGGTKVTKIKLPKLI